MSQCRYNAQTYKKADWPPKQRLERDGPRTIESFQQLNRTWQSKARCVVPGAVRRRPNQSGSDEQRRKVLEAKPRLLHDLWRIRGRAEFVRRNSRAGHNSGWFPVRVAVLLGHRRRCLSKAAGSRLAPRSTVSVGRQTERMMHKI